MENSVYKEDIMLQYEFIHKDDVAIHVLELRDHELYLCYSDEKNCDLFGIEYPYNDYRSIRDLLSEDLYIDFLSICERLGPTYKIIKFNHFIKDQEKTIQLYITSTAYEINQRKFIFGYCKEENQPVSQHLTEVSAVLNQAIYNASFDVLFTLHLTYDHHLLLFSYNKSFLSYFGKTKEHYEYYDLMALLPPDVVSFFADNTKLALSQGSAFSRLLEYEYTKEDCNLYLSPNKNKINLLTTFLPLSLQEYQSVLCCSRDITSEMEAKNETQELIEEYNALFNTTVNATAVFSCKDPFYPVVERQNQRMQEFIKLIGKDCYSNFISSDTWTKLLKTRQTVEDIVSLQPGGQPLHLKIIIVPILHNGVLMKAILSIIDTTDQVNINVRNSIKLSNREEEVISYVLAGEKNDFIATKLCVSVGTIKRTLSNAYSKLGISSRVELLNYYHSRSFNTIRPKANK